MAPYEHPADLYIYFCHQKTRSNNYGLFNTYKALKPFGLLA